MSGVIGIVEVPEAEIRGRRPFRTAFPSLVMWRAPRQMAALSYCLVASAVAVAALDAQALLEPVHLDPQRREFAAVDAVAARLVEAHLDPMRVTTKAGGLATRDEAALNRTLDAILRAAKVAKQLVD